MSDSWISSVRGYSIRHDHPRDSHVIPLALFPNWEQAMLSHAGHFSENPEVLLGEASADAESPLRAWYTEARRATWRSPQDIKTAYRTASILRNNRAEFNVKGNTYRLVVAVKYEFQVVYIRFIGTHAEYDKIKAEEV